VTHNARPCISSTLILGAVSVSLRDLLAEAECMWQVMCSNVLLIAWNLYFHTVYVMSLNSSYDADCVTKINSKVNHTLRGGVDVPLETNCIANLSSCTSKIMTLFHHHLW